MYWRRKRSDYVRGKGPGNRAAFGSSCGTAGCRDSWPTTAAGRSPGAPWRRAPDYPVLASSRILAPVDDVPVWSITLLLRPPRYRRAGRDRADLGAVVDHVKRRGGRVIEGYPIDPGASPFPSAFAWTGLVSAFRKAGFKEVARRSATAADHAISDRVRCRPWNRPSGWPGSRTFGPLLEFMRLLYAQDGLAFDEAAARAALAGIVGDRSLGLVWMIDEGSEPIGYMILTLGYSLVYRGRDAFVDELFIRADRRRRGIGRKGMAIMEQACRDLEVRALHLEVERPNTAAQGLYRKSGFRRSRSYLMTKHLGKP